MLFRKKRIDSGYISPLPNILLCRAIKLHQTDEIFKNAGVWARTTLFATISLTARRHSTYFADLPKISFQFSEKKVPQEGYFTIFCEQGWLPREDYQISSAGVNQHHHVIRLLNQDAESVKCGLSDEEFATRLDKLRQSFYNLQAPVDLCDRPFFLFALQVTSDLNLKRSGLELASIAGQKNAASIIKRKLSELMFEASPDARILFLQHPAGGPDEPQVEWCGRHEFVPNTRKLRALDLASSPNCQGVITINSNTINEAMLFSMPVFQLGDFLTGKFPNVLFPYTLSEFLADPRRCQAISQPKNYLGTILENQWSAEQLRNPAALRSLIQQELSRAEI
jgi:hypothetical protein